MAPAVEATTAYVVPLTAMVSTSEAPPSTPKPPVPLLADQAAIIRGAAVSITTSLVSDSEPGEPGSGSTRLAALPALPAMLPDRAAAP